jgi:hypothetical protein
MGGTGLLKDPKEVKTFVEGLISGKPLLVK